MENGTKPKKVEAIIRDDDDDDDAPILVAKKATKRIIDSSEDEEENVAPSAKSNGDSPVKSEPKKIKQEPALKSPEKEKPLQEKEIKKEKHSPDHKRKGDKHSSDHKRKSVKEEPKKVKAEESSKKRKSEPVKIEKHSSSSPVKNGVSPSKPGSPTKKPKKEEEQVYEWWKEENMPDISKGGKKWSFLEHKGPMFAPPYEPLPENVKFKYDGKVVKLSQDAEEVAGFYAKMLDHDYTSKPKFNENFFKDWRGKMTKSEQKLIVDLKKCDFTYMNTFFKEESERRKNATKEEKNAKKAENEALVEQYGYCIMDGHKERIANFRIEPPGLFRGRGEHPRMGKLKERVMPEDVTINCSKDSEKPKPPDGHKWKSIEYTNSVTWLCMWKENILNSYKYMMLAPTSKLKGIKDMAKYETARALHQKVDMIRREYEKDWSASEMRERQMAVAVYLMDKLALRAGNEKDEEEADTVGCCSLRVEHVKLSEEDGEGGKYMLEFDFLGKDSVRYQNKVQVRKKVWRNIQLFMKNKKPEHDLFDRIDTTLVNNKLKTYMPGLTAKVFRTYNASITLSAQLKELTTDTDSIPQKVLSYNRANRQVAILCNHQRAISKGHGQAMENLQKKIDDKNAELSELKKVYKDAKARVRNSSGQRAKETALKEYQAAKKKYETKEGVLQKLMIQSQDRDENKNIALGTSKLNYLDPRISVAWCKKFNVPIEKVYNKTQRAKFQWAIDMTEDDFEF